MGTKQMIFVLMAIFLAILAGALIHLTTSLYGIGLSYDSVEYIRLARDISANGLQFLREEKLIAQPPVYPALLALFQSWTGPDALIIARIVNITCLSVLMIIILMTARLITRSLPILFMSGLLVLFSIPLGEVYSMAWSESVFILMDPEDFIFKDEQSVLRNPLIANIFYRTSDIEKWSSGLKRIFEECRENGVKVEFRKLKTGFRVVFNRREEFAKPGSYAVRNKFGKFVIDIRAAYFRPSMQIFKLRRFCP